MIKTISDSQAIPETSDVSLPHVLLVLDQMPIALGGGERVALRLAALLPSYGYRVSVLTFFVHPDSTAPRTAPCPVYLLPLSRSYGVGALRAAFAFARFLQEKDVQIVQTFFESSDLWGGLVTKLTSDAKLIWSRRDMGILRGRKHRIAYRLLAGMPDAVFAVSEQVRRHCIEVDRIDPARVITIYNGLDLNHWSGASAAVRREGKTAVTTVGNIRRVKGHDVFIRAAAALKGQFPEACFSIVGEVLEHDYFVQLQNLVVDLGLSDRFCFAGGITDLRSHLSQSDIFVLPSRSEGFSNAIVEAMASSLPVIATDVGGNAEAVMDGVTGFIVPPEDPKVLADAMAALLSDPLKARTMGAEGREVALARFTADAMMSRTISSYRKVLSGY